MQSNVILIDTGAVLALFNSSDPWHSLCHTVFDHLKYPLVTSEAVLTELFHLLQRKRLNPEGAWTFLRSGVIELSPIKTAELGRIQELMSKYSDHRKDFADATLVHLANRESLTTVFTVDHSDFYTYRINGTRRFHVLPTTRP